MVTDRRVERLRTGYGLLLIGFLEITGLRVGGLSVRS